MTDYINAVTSRSLRANAVTKRKSQDFDDDYIVESRKKNKKKPILLSSTESSSNSEDSEFAISSVKTSKTSVSKQLDGFSETATKLFPIFQSSTVKSKEDREDENTLCDPENSVDIQVFKKNLRVRLKIKRSKLRDSPDLTNGSVKSEEVFAIMKADCREQIPKPGRKRSNTKKCIVITEPKIKVHSIFETTKIRNQKDKLQKEESGLLDASETRTLRPRLKKDDSLGINGISDDSNDSVKSVKRKRGRPRTKSIKKQSIKNEMSPIKNNLKPNKIHPMFLSPKEKVKLALEQDLKNNKRTKSQRETLPRNLEKDNSTLSNTCIIIHSSDDEHKEINASVKEHIIEKRCLGSSDNCIILSDDCDVQHKVNDFRYELCFPTMSHVKQSCAPSHFELQTKEQSCAPSHPELQTKSCFMISEEMENEEYLASTWNDFIGLIDASCIEYFKSSIIHVSQSGLSDSLSINSETSLTTDSPLKQNATNNNEKLTVTQNALLWSDIAYFDVNKIIADSAVENVKSWLEAWKLKCSKLSSSNDYNSNEYYESDGSDDDDLGRAIIIYGRPGTGKTSIVHSLAQNLGFSVLEVNASSCRTGRHISSQLQEAFHSYGVHSTIFQDCKKTLSQSDESSSTDEESDKPKIPIARKKEKIFKQGVLTFNVKNESKSIKNSKSKCKNITSFFTKLKTADDTESVNTEVEITPVVDLSPETSDAANNDQCGQQATVSDKKVSTLILFDDVDVVFDEDDGFWFAVNTFLKTTKRPVVLTASRNLEIIFDNLNNNYEVIDFNKTNIAVDLANEVEKLCDKTYDNGVPKMLKTLYENDFRKCLLHLQFWNKQNISHSTPSHTPCAKNEPCSSDIKLVNNACSKSMENGVISEQSNADIESVNCKMLDATDEETIKCELHKPESVNYIPPFNDYFSPLCPDIISKLLHSDNFLDMSPLLMHHHRLNSNILYPRLFNILFCIKFDEWQPSWDRLNDKYFKMITSVNSNVEEEEVIVDLEKSDLSLVSEKTEPAQTSQPCRKSLLDLNYVSSAIADFSFVDVLKSQFACNKYLWLSISEKLDQWTAGLPMCIDDAHPLLENTCLELISSISLLSVRKCYRDLHAINENAATSNVQNSDFSLLSPLTNFNLKKNYTQHILVALPLTQQLNTRSIVLDYVSFLKIICKLETEKKKTFQRSRRFLHYFDSISLNLDPNIFD